MCWLCAAWTSEISREILFTGKYYNISSNPRQEGWIFYTENNVRKNSLLRTDTGAGVKTNDFPENRFAASFI
jgi:hypothetical protein